MEAEAVTKTPNARKKLLINKHFQFRFLAFAGLTAVVACAFFFGAMTFFFERYRQFASEVGFGPVHPFFTVLANMQDMMSWIFGITSALTLAFTWIAGLYFSNKIAGPMYRLQTHFDKVANGETLDGVNFRKGDYFMEVADAYNRQMEYVRSLTEKTDTSLERKTG